MRDVIVPIGAILHMRVMLVGSAIVVAKHHALPRRDGRYALHGHHQCQQQDGNKAEEIPKHRGDCNAACFAQDRQLKSVRRIL